MVKSSFVIKNKNSKFYKIDFQICKVIFENQCLQNF